MDMAQKGDVVYCDPPYAPLNATSFTNYAGESFTYEQQAMLASKAEELQKRGVKVVISNHDTKLTRTLYNKATRILKLDVLRTISTDSSTRGTAPELLAIYEV